MVYLVTIQRRSHAAYFVESGQEFGVRLAGLLLVAYLALDLGYLTGGALVAFLARTREVRQGAPIRHCRGHPGSAGPVSGAIFMWLVGVSSKESGSFAVPFLCFWCKGSYARRGTRFLQIRRERIMTSLVFRRLTFQRHGKAPRLWRGAPPRKGMTLPGMAAFASRTLFAGAFAIIALGLPLPGFAQTPAPTASGKFVHPGLVSTLPELQFVRDKIRAGQEPWLSAFNALKASSAAKRDWTPQPVPKLHVGTNNENPSLGYEEINADSQASWVQGLLWYLTGDEAYAKNAIAISKAWGETLRDIVDEQNGPLNAGWYGTLFCRGAELVKHTYAGWATSGAEQPLVRMLNEEFYPIVTRGDRPTSGFNQNWAASATETVMAIAIFTDDRARFDEAVDYYKTLIPKVINPGGQSSELYRDLVHVQFGLGGYTHIAEMAWHQGVDLYSYRDNRLLKGYEYTATLLNGDTPSPAPTRPINKRRFHPSGWEIALNHYKNRKGLSPTADGARIAGHRPDKASRCWGWGKPNAPAMPGHRCDAGRAAAEGN